MGMRTAKKLGMQHILKPNVGSIFGRPGHLINTVDPLQGLAHGKMSFRH
jgi:hypothetical protein